MERARSLLDEVVADSTARLDELRRELVEIRERQARAVSTAVAELTEFARGDRAPDELRAIQRRIDRGELTWEQAAVDRLRRGY